MKILITGATSKIATNLTKSLSSNHVLVLLSRSQKLSNQAMSYSIDISDKIRLAQIMEKEKPDAVIHLASMLAEACEQDEPQAHKVNIEATKNLARLSNENGVKRFIFASTSAVYNQPKLEPTDEQSNIGPRSVYAKTKLLAEDRLRTASKLRVTEFTTLRLFNVYGPSFSDSLVYKLVHSTKARPVTVFGPNNFYRDYIHISDVVTAFTKCLEREGAAYEVFNIASGHAKSNEQLAESLQARGFTTYLKSIDHAASYSWADISKAKRELDFNPMVELNVDDSRV